MGPDGRPRGFGFVALSSPEAVVQAIPALQSSELRGRRVMVKVAHPRGSAPAGVVASGAGPRGGYQGGGGGGYQGGGGGGYQGGGASEIPPPRAYRPPESPTEFEEGEEGGARASGKAKAVVPARGKVAAKPPAKKGKGAAEEKRSRGGGASWQRWEDWDDE